MWGSEIFIFDWNKRSTLLWTWLKQITRYVVRLTYLKLMCKEWNNKRKFRIIKIKQNVFTSFLFTFWNCFGNNPLLLFTEIPNRKIINSVIKSKNKKKSTFLILQHFLYERNILEWSVKTYNPAILHENPQINRVLFLIFRKKN